MFDNLEWPVSRSSGRWVRNYDPNYTAFHNQEELNGVDEEDLVLRIPMMNYTNSKEEE